MSDRVTQTEHFEGSDLASDRWVPWYLPHWSSRESSRATYDVASSVLRLGIPGDQGLWCGDRHTPPLRTSDRRPSYPLQLFVGVFDFPDREDGTTRDHEPVFEVDSITHGSG